MTQMHPEYPVGPDWSPETPLRVLVANVYVANKRLAEDLALFEDLEPDAVGVSEGWRIPTVEKYGFRRVRSWDQGRYSGEVPVLARRSTTTARGSRFVKAAKGVPGQGIANPRWITVARLEKDGRRFAVVNTHMHAVIVGRRGNPLKRTRRVRQYRKHMRTLLRVIEHERESGFEPIVTGDLNYPPRGKPWRWSPERALARVGLRWVAHRVDGFAYDPDVFEASHDLIEPKGSDHDKYVLAHLRWRT